MLKYLLILSICGMSHAPVYGQLRSPIGTWNSYLPLHQGKRVCQTRDRVVYASDWGLISINPDDLSAKFLSKANGLSEIGIENIHHDPFNDQLIILYDNSNIDLIRDQEVVTVSNVKNNTSIPGDKKLYHVFFSNERKSYISAGFGIVEFDPESLIFGATIFTGVKTNEAIEFKNRLYALTEEGLYSVNLGENRIINDFSQWILYGPERGLPSLYNASASLLWEDDLMIATDETLYRSSDGLTFRAFYEVRDPAASISFLKTFSDGLAVGLKGNNFSRILLLDSTGDVLKMEDQCPSQVNGAVEDINGTVWYADDFNDIKYSTDIGGPCKRLNYNSPYFIGVGEISIDKDKVLVASGGVSENFNYLFSREGYYVLERDQWLNFNEFLDPRIRDLNLLSINRIIGHPLEDKIYAGSYWAGMAEYDSENNTFTLYNKSNSTLRGAIGDEARERVSALAFDHDLNLWVAAYGAPKPLNVFTKDGLWYSFSTDGLNSLIDLAIDKNGFLWAPVYGNAGGLIVYDPGDNVEDGADDRIRLFNRSNSELTTNSVNTVEVDRDGVVWAGTSEGPVLFDCGEDVFDLSCNGLRRKVQEDSIAAFLLADQDILSVAFDGANRKWFGTRNGIFVQSPDGIASVERFNTSTSPLFDNHIISLAYRPTNGEMMIGTSQGLMGYQTATSPPEAIHKKDRVVVFPNPVEPGYDGIIAIRGLVENARVKITDINGFLVFETRALGGTATWNGRDVNNQRVSSGVYLVFSSEEGTFDSPDAFATKLLILR